MQPSQSHAESDDDFHLVEKKSNGRGRPRGGRGGNTRGRGRGGHQNGERTSHRQDNRQNPSAGSVPKPTSAPKVEVQSKPVVITKATPVVIAQTSSTPSYSAIIAATTNNSAQSSTGPTFYSSPAGNNRGGRTQKSTKPSTEKVSHEKPSSRGAHQQKGEKTAPRSAPKNSEEQRPYGGSASGQRKPKPEKREVQQPQVVARRGTRNTTQFFIVRKPLQETPLVFNNSNLKPTIPKEPEDEMGKAFYRELKQFVEDKNAYVHDFSNTLNLAQRKRLHSLAEEFQLDHFSRGSNPYRYICVSKRDMKMKDEFQYFGYIGLFGNSVDELVRKYNINPNMSENQPLLQKRVKRDGPIHHITLMTRPEINTALKNLTATKEYAQLFNEEQNTIMKHGSEEEKIEILMNVISKVVSCDYEAVGLGKVSQEEQPNVDSVGGSSHSQSEEKKLNEAYFVIINWPSAQRLRAILGLEPYHFHITVAYKFGDIHGVMKDKSTLLPKDKVFEVTDQFMEGMVSEMASLLKYIGVNERYAHSFVTLGWLSIDSLVTIDRMDLNDLGVFDESEQNKILGFIQDFSNNIKKFKSKK